MIAAADHSTKIADGMLVTWHPKDIGRIVGRRQKYIDAFRSRFNLPITGMIKDIRGDYGILSYMEGEIRKQTFVKTDEVQPAGMVRNVAE